ncbi:MAG: hypothetical protein AABY92_09905, partial [Thermodesulfobacteriota bacterium]
MFKEDESGRNIYLLEERMKIASRTEEAKALEEEADGYVSIERWSLAYKIYELALRRAIKSENVIWYKDLEIKFYLAKVKIIYDAYLSMNNQARMKNISCLYAVVESLTKVINRRPVDSVKLAALRGLRDIYRRIYQDNRNKKATQEAAANAVKFGNRVLLFNHVSKEEDLEVLGDIYLEISNRSKALNLYTQALGKYKGFTGEMKNEALRRKIERISGSGYDSSSPMSPALASRVKDRNRSLRAFAGGDSRKASSSPAVFAPVAPLLKTHGDMYNLTKMEMWRRGYKKVLIFNFDAHPDNYFHDDSSYDSTWAWKLGREGQAVVIHMPSYFDGDCRQALTNWRRRVIYSTMPLYQLWV